MNNKLRFGHALSAYKIEAVGSPYIKYIYRNADCKDHTWNMAVAEYLEVKAEATGFPLCAVFIYWVDGIEIAQDMQARTLEQAIHRTQKKQIDRIMQEDFVYVFPTRAKALKFLKQGATTVEDTLKRRPEASR